MQGNNPRRWTYPLNQTFAKLNRAAECGYVLRCGDPCSIRRCVMQVLFAFFFTSQALRHALSHSWPTRAFQDIVRESIPRRRPQGPPPFSSLARAPNFLDAIFVLLSTHLPRCQPIVFGWQIARVNFFYKINLFCSRYSGNFTDKPQSYSSMDAKPLGRYATKTHDSQY